MGQQVIRVTSISVPGRPAQAALATCTNAVAKNQPYWPPHWDVLVFRPSPAFHESVLTPLCEFSFYLSWRGASDLQPDTYTA